MPDPIGLYLHIPFCEKKCAYCDFYSAFVSEKGITDYLNALSAEMKKWGGRISRPIDTIYVGGGTPSVLGSRIGELLSAVFENFRVTDGAEITVEMNPSQTAAEFLFAAKNAGANRLSVGVQTRSDERLKMLGRSHTAKDAAHAVALARRAGFSNISLDLMIGLPGSTVDTVREDADFILEMEPEHLSAYLLKIEPNTRFAACADSLGLPDEDETARQYLYLCECAERAGYRHYEISNFAKPGFESRHNLKYWRCEEYLGLGPAAHSFLSGERFYYPRDLRAFMKSPETVPDGTGGEREERLMLALRLADGIDFGAYPGLFPLCEKLRDAGYAVFSDGRLSLTNRGMLVSNRIITEITEALL